MISKDSDISISRQCQLLKVNRSSYYYKHVPVSDQNLELMRLIDELHLNKPHMGSRQMTDRLKDQGFEVNRKRIQRLMRLMGIQAIYPRPKTSVGNKAHTIYPYLLRELRVDRANQAWSSDITYIPMQRGFCYLVAIMDLYSRKILSWRLSNTLDKRFCIEALQEALEHYPKPEIFNSDQGSQFTSNEFTSILKQQNIKVSMDSKGSWIDNVFIERFWRSLKYEEVYLRAYQSVPDAKAYISTYIQDYNQARRHSSLKRQTPDYVYTQSMNSLIPLHLNQLKAAFTPRSCS